MYKYNKHVKDTLDKASLALAAIKIMAGAMLLCHKREWSAERYEEVSTTFYTVHAALVAMVAKTQKIRKKTCGNCRMDCNASCQRSGHLTVAMLTLVDTLAGFVEWTNDHIIYAEVKA